MKFKKKSKVQSNIQQPKYIISAYVFFSLLYLMKHQNDTHSPHAYISLSILHSQSRSDFYDSLNRHTKSFLSLGLLLESTRVALVLHQPVGSICIMRANKPPGLQNNINVQTSRAACKVPIGACARHAGDYAPSHRWSWRHEAKHKRQDRAPRVVDLAVVCVWLSGARVLR